MDLFSAESPLPPGSFAEQPEAQAVVGAFAADPAAGSALPFDLVASAFALLVCWDERTCGERDRFGRLAFGDSVFAVNPELKIADPAADRYVELLRGVLRPRLEESGCGPLRPPGWMWAGDGREPAPNGGSPFAVALTHDVDNLWRWTRRGFAAAGYRSARALRRPDAAPCAARSATSATGSHVTCPAHRSVLDLPADPRWRGRPRRTVHVLHHRPAHPPSGRQPAGDIPAPLPEALALLRRHGREVGLHGNDSDRLGREALDHDRELLARASDGEVRGIRYHYLRCLYHETLPLLEQAGFSYDTSLAFAEHEGYRCGCSFPFRPYCLDQERPLDLVELPLAVMDATLQQAHYRGLSAPSAEEAACRSSRAVLAAAAR